MLTKLYKLNELDDPAVAINIEEGTQAYNDNGELVEGTYVKPILLESINVSISSNGSTTINPTGNYDAIKAINLTTNVQPTLQAKSTTITENGTSAVTFDSSYDGLSAVTINVNVPSSGGGGEPTDGAYRVRYIGYNGEILQEGWYNTDDVVTPPSIEWMVTKTVNNEAMGGETEYNLTFVEWTSSIGVFGVEEELTVTNQDVDLGAVYETSSGNSFVFITLTPVTGLDFTIANCSVDNIDWGDGESSSSVESHTYTEYGDYAIEIEGLSDWTTSPYGGGLFENSSSNRNYSVTEVWLGSDVTSIDYYAFDCCYSLTSLVIPNSVTSIGNNAFNCCYSLTSVTIPNSVTSIGPCAFQDCHSLTSVTISNSVTSIVDYAFQDCPSLTSVVIPNSITSIGDYAFSSCYSLTSVVIPNSITSIGDYAFNFCDSLTSLVIPNSVTSIGDYAFNFCQTLIEYDFTAYTESDSVPTLSSANAFRIINGICKMVFSSSAVKDAFAEETNWVTFADYMYYVDINGDLQQ